MESIRRKYTCGDAIHAMRDYIRLTAITYQSFGLDKNKTVRRLSYFLEAPPRLELGVKVLQTSALPLGYGALCYLKGAYKSALLFGAGYEARTRYLHLGKVALYQMS